MSDPTDDDLALSTESGEPLDTEAGDRLVIESTPTNEPPSIAARDTGGAAIPPTPLIPASTRGAAIPSPFDAPTTTVRDFHVPSPTIPSTVQFGTPAAANRHEVAIGFALAVDRLLFAIEQNDELRRQLAEARIEIEHLRALVDRLRDELDQAQPDPETVGGFTAVIAHCLRRLWHVGKVPIRGIEAVQAIAAGYGYATDDDTLAVLVELAESVRQMWPG